MAEALVESLSADFEPNKYRDNYREQVLDLIERKAAGEQFEAPAARGGGARGHRPDGCARGQREGGEGGPVASSGRRHRSSRWSPSQAKPKRVRKSA